MTRDMTAAMQAAVQANEVRPFYLLDLLFTSGSIFLWTGTGELVHNGNTYIGAGNLLSITEAEETVALTGADVRYTLSGINPALIAVAIAENYQGRPVRLWFGAFSTTDNTIIADPVRISAGYMDTMDINEAEETATIALKVENELSSLSRPNVRRRTDVDQKQTHPEDTFFSLLEDIPTRIVWG